MNMIQRLKPLLLKAWVRISIYIILIGFGVQIESKAQLAQETETVSLKSAIGIFEKHYGMYFSFDPNEIKGLKVGTTAITGNIRNDLDRLLNTINLDYRIIEEEYVVLKRAASKFLSLEIIDSESNSPLPFSTIKKQGTTSGIISDENGKAKVVISEPKSTTLEVLYLGFKSKLISVDSLGNYQDLKINLQPEPIELNEFELKEYLNPGIASDPKANSFKIFPQEMKILPGLSERDVLLSAQIISGVNSNDESASGINVRGSSRDNTLLYWNNIPIYNTAHYFGSISSFIPSSIGTLDIFKNYIPVEYGGASAGLIRLESRNEVDESLTVEASINMTHGDAFVKAPFLVNKGSMMFAARRSYNDAIPTFTYNAYGEKLFGRQIRDPQGVFYENEFDNDLNFSDINFQWNYEPSDRSSVKIGFINSGSKFNYRERDPQNRQNISQDHIIKSKGADLSWVYRLNDNNSFLTSLAYSDYAMAYAYTNLRNPELDTDDDIESRSNDINNLEARIAHTKRFNDRHKLSVGYQFNSFNINNEINTESILEPDETESIDTDSYIHALYSDLNLAATDRLELVLSGRLTNINSINETVFSPQLKINYNPTSSLLLKSSYGIYHQYLSTIKESQFTLSNAIEQHWLLADDEELVPLIINRQTSIGAIYNANNWLLDLDIYKKNVDGILARNLGFIYDADNDFEQGSEQISGVDFTLRKRWRYFRAWFSYNFQNSDVKFEELFDESFSSNLNIRHQYNLSSSYTKGNWEFSLGYSFKSGAPFTRLENIRLNRRDRNGPPGPGPGNPDDDDEFELEFSDPNTNRLPVYHRVDASIWHRFSGENWKGEIGLSFINLFNRRNINNIGYLVDFNREGNVAIIERTKYFLRFTPNISLRISF